VIVETRRSDKVLSCSEADPVVGHLVEARVGAYGVARSVADQTRIQASFSQSVVEDHREKSGPIQLSCSLSRPILKCPCGKGDASESEEGG
jgi:hypothetical protein